MTSLQEYFLNDVSPVDGTAFIHPKAHVQGSKIGARTKVWQFASVIRNSHLGDDCNVGSGATVDGAWLGDGCLVCPGAFVVPGTYIGNDVFIGPNVTICNDAWPSTCKDGFEVDILLADFVSVEIKDGASVGANAVILPGVKIGRNALVAAGAVARTSIPDNHLLQRDGSLLKIKSEWRKRRMRQAA